MTAAPADIRMTGRQKATLVVLLGAQAMFAIDFSILTVALPVIGRDLGFGIDSLQWVVTSFALAAAGLTLLCGRISDLLGRKRLFLAGMALLTISSLIGGLAQTPAILLAARIAQGVATAMVIPSGMALLTTSFPEGALRNKALGLNGALLSLGFASGAVLGGVLTDLLSWRWTFLINVPAGAILLTAAWFLIRESRAPQRPALDVPGAITVTLGLLALVFGVTSVERHGWSSPATWGPLLAAAALLAAFYRIELRAPQPLAPLRILRANTVKWGNFAGLITFAMESGLSFLLTLYLQQVLGLTPFQTGLMFGFLGLGAFLGGTFAAHVIARTGTRGALVFGLALQALTTGAMYWLGQATTPNILFVLAATFLGGFGHVLAIVAYTITATSGVADHEQGLATGLTSMTQQIAFSLGIPIMSTVALAHSGPMHGSTKVLEATTFGIAVNGAVVLLGAALVLAFLRPVATTGPTAAQTPATTA
ncbi:MULTISPECIES: MFS transporter [unclassified Crossiella]|uniref:MFS transporter n=1 Tax=unclassified Crossiella TaxID=2620835 RepID=UPI001FFFEF73|nr:MULTISPECIES: MFS transporter [unclassified Crossiella]MCK2240023.1 MFS transporter [Crossiella sp. S99.2]MCK2252731.1 MFS transporter [Crossiella sp. S99.1]